MKNSLVLRSITGIVFVAIIVSCILCGPVSFAALFTVITGLTVYEFSDVINKNKEDIHINKIVTTAGGIYLFLAFTGYCSNTDSSRIFLPYLILLMYLMISELYLKHTNPIMNWACSMLSQLYVALPLSLLNVLYFQYGANDVILLNPILPLALFVFLWLNDTGAYCVGSLIGKHKLFERISPKKSWEGSIGGAIITIVIAIVCAHLYPFISTIKWVGLAIVIVAFGTWGDLTESLLKRQLNIKDSGNILPGHGGMLDRFDSSLMAIPAAICYLFFIS